MMDMIAPLFNPQDDAWVWLVGRYMLNMGAVEAATRVLVVHISGSDRNPVFADELASRLGFIRARFPRSPVDRHAWAMNVLTVALKLTGFRNIIAHSPLAISNNQDGTLHIHGILGFTAKDAKNVGQLISLEELTGRVDESAAVAKQLMDMQSDFETKKL